MKHNEVNDTEEYWTKAVGDFFRLGMKEAVVPVLNLQYDVAKTIAFKVNARVEIKRADYVFIKM